MQGVDLDSTVPSFKNTGKAFVNERRRGPFGLSRTPLELKSVGFHFSLGFLNIGPSSPASSRSFPLGSTVACFKFSHG